MSAREVIEREIRHLQAEKSQLRASYERQTDRLECALEALDKVLQQLDAETVTATAAPVVTVSTSGALDGERTDWKRCDTCRQNLPVTEFLPDGRTKDKLTKYCRTCGKGYRPPGEVSWENAGAHPPIDDAEEKPAADDGSDDPPVVYDPDKLARGNEDPEESLRQAQAMREDLSFRIALVLENQPMTVGGLTLSLRKRLNNERIKSTQVSTNLMAHTHLFHRDKSSGQWSLSDQGKLWLAAHRQKGGKHDTD
jgi:hypothetical protein